MASGLPVVATDVGPPVLIVEEEGAGFVVPYESEAFARAIIKLVNNPQLGKEMGNRGKMASLKYDWNTLLKNEFEAISKVIKG